ncbi:hypothetical protein C5167_030637 [Papaver somniferum]|nr:hypothetical protein C5167_030637 [Papaver somniferum]
MGGHDYTENLKGVNDGLTDLTKNVNELIQAMNANKSEETERRKQKVIEQRQQREEERTQRFLCSHNDFNCMCKQFGKALYLNWMIVYLRGACGFSKSSPPYSCSKFPTGQIKHVQFAKIWYTTNPYMFNGLV